MPEFVLTDSNNKPRSSGEWAGQSLIINFWATWCPPCLREMPLLKTLQAERATQNFKVIGIALDRREPVLDYMKENGIEFPVLIGEDDVVQVAEEFGVNTIALPFTVFTDNQGRIVTMKLGELNAANTAALLDTIHSINAGQITLEQAQTQLKKR